jgi:hypothetical protein
VEKDGKTSASTRWVSPEKSVSEIVIADVAVSNDKVSFELLPTRDAEAANEDVVEKVNFAMAI